MTNPFEPIVFQVPVKDLQGLTTQLESYGESAEQIDPAAENLKKMLNEVRTMTRTEIRSRMAHWVRERKKVQRNEFRKSLHERGQSGRNVDSDTARLDTDQPATETRSRKSFQRPKRTTAKRKK